VRQIFPVQGDDIPLLTSPADGPLPAAVVEVARLYDSPPEAGRWLRANMVASTDGAASVGGRSGALSGPADRMIFTILRSLADLVLVGAGTAIAERYRPAQTAGLWTRLRPPGAPPPAIAVVTGRLSIDPTSPLVTGAAPGAPTIVITTTSAPADRREALAPHVRLIEAGRDHVDLPSAVAELTGRGYHRILCEGGPSLLGTLSAAGLLDELCLTISPLIAGGTAGRIITAGSAAGDGAAGPERMRLAHLLADDNFLLSRYVRDT